MMSSSLQAKNVRATNIGRNSINIRWDPPEGEKNVLRYEILHRLSGADEFISTPSFGYQHERYIKDLIYGGMYEIKVKVVCLVGSNTESESCFVRTGYS